MGQPPPALKDGERVVHVRPRDGGPPLQRVVHYPAAAAPPRTTREISGPPGDTFPNRVTR